MIGMNLANVFHVFARGYSHIKDNTVCQDASWSDQNEKRSIIIVADGHGNKRYCRSDKGSQFAVNCAAQVIDEFLEENTEKSLFETEKQCNDTLTKLCNCIIAKWHAAVKKETDENPFTEEELKEVPETYAEEYLNGDRIEKAYGTTLIAVFAFDERCFGIHIGDGKCVAVYDDGSIDEPIPWDENCAFNVTTSICDEEASKEFRFAEIHNPAAVFIGTDGIDDSYGTSLYSFYLNVINMMQTRGYEDTIGYLREYMSKLSENGSHDDVSLAGIVDTGKLEDIRETVALRIKQYAIENELSKAESKVQDLNFAVAKSERILRNLEEETSENADNSEKIQTMQEQYEKLSAELEEHQDKIRKLKYELEHLTDEESDNTEQITETWEDTDGSAGIDSKMPQQQEDFWHTC